MGNNWASPIHFPIHLFIRKMFYPQLSFQDFPISSQALMPFRSLQTPRSILFEICAVKPSHRKGKHLCPLIMFKLRVSSVYWLCTFLKNQARFLGDRTAGSLGWPQIRLCCRGLPWIREPLRFPGAGIIAQTTENGELSAQIDETEGAIFFKTEFFMTCIIPGRNNLDETNFVPRRRIVRNIYKAINPSFRGINSQRSTHIWPNK